MAEVLNDYFASLFTVELQEIIPAQLNLISLSDIELTEDTVAKALDKIKVNQIPSPDCIAPRVLKEAKYLAILFNKSLNFGRIPDIWKLANANTK